MIAAIDYALSAGPNCRAKHQLLRRYGAVAVGGVFDWQLTPIPSIIAYLERDFTGLFELADLELRDGFVFNTRFGTMHQHEFPTWLKSQTDVAAWYDRARSRHDHVCATTRRTLRSGRTVLLAMSETLAPATRDELARAFAAYAGPTTALHLMAEPAVPDPKLGWEGDPAAWDRMLAPYPARLTQRVRMTLRSLAKQHHRRPPRLAAQG